MIIIMMPLDNSHNFDTCTRCNVSLGVTRKAKERSHFKRRAESMKPQFTVRNILLVLLICPFIIHSQAVSDFSGVNFYEPRGVVQEKLAGIGKVMHMTSMDLDDSDPNAQFQIDCFGVEYAGFPRKIEARFGDDRLNTVWILTGSGEEDRLRKKFS